MTTSLISEKKQQDVFDLEKLADNELENFSKLMTFDTASIQILRDKQRYLIGAWGFPKDNNPRLLRGIDHDKLIKPIVERKKITILSNIAGEDNWSAKVTPKVHSWICAPLIVDDKVIGLLTIDSHNPNSYSYKEHGKLVEKFASDAAGKIKQRLSSYESKRRIEQLESLIAIGNKITSKIELNENELFDLVEKYARGALNIRNTTIMLINDAEKIHTVKASRNGEVVNVYTEGWEPRDKNDGRGKVKYIIDERKTLVLYAQYILDEKDEDYDKKVLFSDDDSRKRYKFSSIPNKEVDNEVPDCWIGVPIKRKNKVLGVISAFSWGHEYQFAADYDSKILEALADKTAIALDNIRKYREADKLKHLVDFTHKITSEISLSESEILKLILDLIHKQASKVMDTDNMYIALYNEFDNEIQFGLVFEKGEKVKRKPRRRKTGEEEGKTEFIIRTKKYLFHPTKKDSEQWYIENKKKNHWGFSAPSWIGVPMLFRDKVLGVIATYHPTEECCYSKGDVEILQAIAESAAIALQNAEKYTKSEHWAFLGQLSASLAHRIGNTGGMIRLCVQELKDHLDNDNKVSINNKFLESQINIIQEENEYILELSDVLFTPVRAFGRKLECIDIVERIDRAIKKIKSYLPSDISIIFNHKGDIPDVYGNFYLTEAFLEIISNAVNAMEDAENKKIIIDIKVGQQFVQVDFSDTGKGFLDENKIYKIFPRLSEKMKGGHKGFGLWWVRNFIKEHIKGELIVKPSDGKYTTISAYIPIAKP